MVVLAGYRGRNLQPLWRAESGAVGLCQKREPTPPDLSANLSEIVRRPRVRTTPWVERIVWHRFGATISSGQGTTTGPGTGAAVGVALGVAVAAASFLAFARPRERQR